MVVFPLQDTPYTARTKGRFRLLVRGLAILHRHIAAAAVAVATAPSHRPCSSAATGIRHAAGRRRAGRRRRPRRAIHSC